MPYFIQNFNRPIGSSDINEFLEGRFYFISRMISKNFLSMLIRVKSRVAVRLKRLKNSP